MRAKNVTIDVGQVMFGQTVTISSDVLRQFNARQRRQPEEMDHLRRRCAMAAASCRTTIAPTISTTPCNGRSGLELFLLIDDPWRVFFTTDHPNGAPFTTYPDIFALLMSRDLRAEWIADAAAGRHGGHHAAVDHARIFARRDRHHDARGAGAPARPRRIAAISAPARVADIAVYADDADRAEMFRAAALVFKDGELVVRDGDGHAASASAARSRVRPERDRGDRAAHARLLRRALRAVAPTSSRCRRAPSAGPIRSSSCHAHADRQRRPHRRHLRRSLPHARDRRRSSRPTARTGRARPR